MSSNSKLDLASSVPKLTTTNFSVYQEKMSAYLKAAKVWRIVTGDKKIPGDPKETDFQDKLNTWHEQDDQAQGLIQMSISDSLVHHIKGAKTSKEMWDLIATKLSTVGPSTVFADFQQLLRTSLSPADPLSGIDKMQTLFQRLEHNHIDIPKFVRIMMILNGLPQGYDGLVHSILFDAVHYVAPGGNQSTVLEIGKVIEQVRSEYFRKNPHAPQSQGSAHANKISAVKCARPNPPKYQPRTGPSQGSSEGPAANQQHSHQYSKPWKGKGRGTSAGKTKGKGPWKGKEKAHFASSAMDSTPDGQLPIQTLPNTVIYGNGSIFTPHPSSSTDWRIRNNQSLAIGNIPGPGPFTDLDGARTLANSIGVPPTAQNLTRLVEVPALQRNEAATSRPLSAPPTMDPRNHRIPVFEETPSRISWADEMETEDIAPTIRGYYDEGYVNDYMEYEVSRGDGNNDDMGSLFGDE